jgi:opacity protein-like surface antigen
MALTGWVKKKLGGVTIALLLVFCWANHAAAQDINKWQYELTLYGWYTDIGGTVNHPGSPVMPEGPFKFDASDILDSLSMVFMGGFEARKNRWSIITDMVYLDVGGDKTTTITTRPGVPVTASVDLDISTWIIGGAIGYDLVQDDRMTLAVVGGARYTAMDTDSTLTLQGVTARSSKNSASEDLLDGIVGVRGFINLTEHWYLPYYADIGAGGSDLTWQALAGIGYRFSWGDLKLAYRYLDYEMDDGKLLADLNVSGFLLGISFHF